MSPGPHDVLIARAWRRSRLVTALHGTPYTLQPVAAGLLIAVLGAGVVAAPELLDRVQRGASATTSSID